MTRNSSDFSVIKIMMCFTSLDIHNFTACAKPEYIQSHFWQAAHPAGVGVASVNQNP